MRPAEVIVIGAGAAGLLAAGAAAGQGMQAIMLERMPQPGRKLRITGKGRCNLTNTGAIEHFMEQFGKNGRFLRQAFERFSSRDLIDLLARQKVDVVSERGGRVFPASNKAADVAHALTAFAVQSGARLRTNQNVEKIVIRDNRVLGVKTDAGVYYSAPAVIVATGGKSYPLTGSTGDGYRFARMAGHTVVPVHAALVPLESRDVPGRKIAGLKLVNVNAFLLVENVVVQEQFGEVGFTQSGMTGPSVLSMSSMAVAAIDQGKTVGLILDLKPALDPARLDARILRDIDSHGNSDFRWLLNGLLPLLLIDCCMSALQINPEKRLHQIRSTERLALGKWLKNLSFSVDGYRPIEEALITAGGVSLSEVDPRTMASRKVQGLYFAGELLDVDARTGGYNLQAAFSTGVMAGLAAADFVKSRPERSG